MTKLDEYLKSVKDSPFEWGSFDCYQFTSNCVRLQDGKGFPATYPYKTPKGALRQIRGFCKEANLTNVTDYLDVTYMRVAKNTLPPSGSVVLRRYDDPAFDFIFGICTGCKVVFPGTNGLEFTDIDFNTDNFWVI